MRSFAFEELSSEVVSDTVVEEPVAISEGVIQDAVPNNPVPEQVVKDPPVAVSTDRDSVRLELTAFQSLSYESTGEYTQIKENKEFIDGDVIGFDASAKRILSGKEELHVYDAPCGRGWQLIVHDTELQNVFSSTTKSYFKTMVPIVRSYGYGCEHDSRTANW